MFQKLWEILSGEKPQEKPENHSSPKIHSGSPCPGIHGRIKELKRRLASPMGKENPDPLLEELSEIGTLPALKALVTAVANGTEARPALQLLQQKGDRGIMALVWALDDEELAGVAEAILMRGGIRELDILSELFPFRSTDSQNLIIRIASNMGFRTSDQSLKTHAAAIEQALFTIGLRGSATFPSPYMAQKKNEDFPLHHAAAQGDEKLVETLLDQGMFPNATDFCARRPIQTAVEHDRRNIVELLLAKGVPLKPKNRLSTTVLHTAAEFGRLELASLLLDKGVAPDFGFFPVEYTSNSFAKISRFGMPPTPTELAIRNGHTALFELLFSRIIDKPEFRQGGSHLLKTALNWGRFELAELLLKKGCKLHDSCLSFALKSQNQEILCFAQKYSGQISGNSLIEAILSQTPETIQKLLAGGISPDITGSIDYTEKPGPAITAEAEELQAVAARRGDFSLTSSPGADRYYHLLQTTPLHAAVIRGDPAIVRLLLDHCAQVDGRDSGQKTPLHIAAEFGRAALIEMLIKGGADPEARNTDGSTPWLLAGASGCVHTLKALLAAGINQRAVNKFGNDILSFCVTDRSGECLRFLLKETDLAGDQTTGQWKTLLGSAVFNRASAVVKTLLAEITDPQVIQEGFEQIFHFHGQAFELFPLFQGRELSPNTRMECRIQLYAKVFGEDRTWYQDFESAPILIAAAFCRDDIIKDLIQMGADPGITDSQKSGLKAYWGKDHASKKPWPAELDQYCEF